jgi:hypothetical protein
LEFDLFAQLGVIDGAIAKRGDNGDSEPSERGSFAGHGYGTVERKRRMGEEHDGATIAMAVSPEERSHHTDFNDFPPRGGGNGEPEGNR